MLNSNNGVDLEINIPAFTQAVLVFVTLLITSHFMIRHCEIEQCSSIDDNWRDKDNKSSDKTKRRVRFDLTQSRDDMTKPYNPQVHLKSLIPIFILYQNTLLRKLKQRHFTDTLARLITSNALETLTYRITNNTGNQFKHETLSSKRYRQLIKDEVDQTLKRLECIRAIIQRELKELTMIRQHSDIQSQYNPHRYHHVFNHVNNHVLQHWDLYREQTQNDDTECKIASLTLQAVVLGT